MSHPKSSVNRKGFAGWQWEGNGATPPTDRKPIGTCQTISKCHQHRDPLLHSIGFLAKRVNNQLLIFLPPSPHRRI